MASDLLAKRQRQARWWFTRYRNIFYDGKLEGEIVLEVAPGKLRCQSWGETYFENDRAVLVRLGEANWSHAGTANHSFLKSTIIHELMHCYLGPNIKHDSQEWRDEALRLGRLGALVETI